jgi:hypothetical protein
MYVLFGVLLNEEVQLSYRNTVEGPDSDFHVLVKLRHFDK